MKLNKNECIVFLENSLITGSYRSSYLLFDPVKIIKVCEYSEIESVFSEIDKLSRKFYIAGYFSYEMGYVLDEFFNDKKIIQSDIIRNKVLINLAVFKKCIKNPGRETIYSIFGDTNGKCQISNIKLSESKESYADKIKRIKDYIKRGDTYQVNFTMNYNFNFTGDPWELYQHLKLRQPVNYSAFIKMENKYILSLSPELFFKLDRQEIISRPMKGTIRRGYNLVQDRINSDILKESEKDKAENLMIVDLLRNDLGRICRTGTVSVPAMFEIEKYRTVFQMTSMIKGKLRQGITYYDIFKAIFPCGSVTGAPKLRTMEIIKQLENDDRDVYCGAIGIIFPGKKAVFNVPIRTVVIDNNKGKMGIGSGVTFDSDPGKEYRECLLKAEFLTKRVKRFEIIESILWDRKYFLLKRHLKRMKSASEYFGYKFNMKSIQSKLLAVEKKVKKGKKYKVRFLLSEDGKIKSEYAEIEISDDRKMVTISDKNVSSQNSFLYYKTTNRELFNKEYIKYSKKGFYDVIFLNEKGELTESARNNLVLRFGKKMYTPPVGCGLLPGTYRDYLINKDNVKEKVLYVEDLKKADEIILCNSIRKSVHVYLSDKNK